jgi:(E)-4-hydroxy-3-methylbut-2-enyl-diphosphate synthase
MGCAVNGPGEARRADVGLAGAGRGQAVLFADGQALRTVPVERAVDELWQEIERIADSRGASLAPRGEAR